MVCKGNSAGCSLPRPALWGASGSAVLRAFKGGTDARARPQPPGGLPNGLSPLSSESQLGATAPPLSSARAALSLGGSPPRGWQVWLGPAHHPQAPAARAFGWEAETWAGDAAPGQSGLLCLRGRQVKEDFLSLGSQRNGLGEWSGSECLARGSRQTEQGTAAVHTPTHSVPADFTLHSLSQRCRLVKRTL